MTGFLIAESLTGGFRLDLRDQNKAYSDYALWRSGKSFVHWKDLVRSMLHQKTVELKHHVARSRRLGLHVLSEEREVVRDIFGCFRIRVPEQLSYWQGAFRRQGTGVLIVARLRCVPVPKNWQSGNPLVPFCHVPLCQFARLPLCQTEKTGSGSPKELKEMETSSTANLPTVKNVALVPSNSLVRKNDWELENDQLWNAPAATN